MSVCERKVSESQKLVEAVPPVLVSRVSLEETTRYCWVLVSKVGNQNRTKNVGNQYTLGRLLPIRGRNAVTPMEQVVMIAMTMTTAMEMVKLMFVMT